MERKRDACQWDPLALPALRRLRKHFFYFSTRNPSRWYAFLKKAAASREFVGVNKAFTDFFFFEPPGRKNSWLFFLICGNPWPCVVANCARIPTRVSSSVSERKKESKHIEASVELHMQWEGSSLLPFAPATIMRTVTLLRITQACERKCSKPYYSVGPFVASSPRHYWNSVQRLVRSAVILPRYLKENH